MRKPQTNFGPTSSKVGRTGIQKMQMGHQRTRKEIERINLERAKRADTGKPRHIEGSHRR
jgi:hypothetical protein